MSSIEVMLANITVIILTLIGTIIGIIWFIKNFLGPDIKHKEFKQ